MNRIRQSTNSSIISIVVLLLFTTCMFNFGVPDAMAHDDFQDRMIRGGLTAGAGLISIAGGIVTGNPYAIGAGALAVLNGGYTMITADPPPGDPNPVENNSFYCSSCSSWSSSYPCPNSH